MNTKTLASLYNALSDREQDRMIHCRSAHEAWHILESTHEGNSRVKVQRLQGLMIDFKNLSMADNESIDEFYSRGLKYH